jgi:hypothetical protein
MQETILSLQESINFDKEEMLEKIVSYSGMTPEEFSADFLIEEYPVHIWNMSSNEGVLDLQFGVSQHFRIRSKTEDERQLELESKEKTDATPTGN